MKITIVGLGKMGANMAERLRRANAVPVPALSAALYARFASRQEDSPAMKAIATLRNQFGGHDVRPS